MQITQSGGKEMRQFNIYHRKDGRWEGRIPSNQTPGQGGRYTAFYGKTKEEVAAKMSQFRTKFVTADISLTVAELYVEWLRCNQPRLKESTIANYMMKAEKHILPAFGACQVTSLTLNEVYDFIRQKQEAGLSNRYISDILVLMKSVFRYGVMRYRINNPIDGLVMPKRHKSEVRLLTKSEQERLEQYIAENRSLTTLGIALSKSTGLRIGELCALQWEDIDLEKRILTVRKTMQRIRCKNGNRKTKLIITDPKTENSRRAIPIPAFLIGFLRQYQSVGKDYVLSGTQKPVEPRTMQHRFVRVLKNANLPSVHFHSLRHNFASNCIALGFDVKALSEILGHSNVEITLDLYVHSSFEQKVEYMSRLKMAV